MRRRNDPTRHEPSNGTQEQIKSIYEQLESEGVDDVVLARLRADHGDSRKYAIARGLQEEHLTPPTMTQQINEQLERADLSESEREDVESMLACAGTMDGVNPDRADELREEALTLAEYGEPQSYAAALSDSKADRIAGLEARAQTLSGMAPDRADELREQAVDVARDALAEQGLVDGDDDETAVRRDAEATVETITADQDSHE